MAELLLIVRLAGNRVALPASEVEAVVEIDAITRVPQAASHVAGLAALRSRVLTVIDSRVSLEEGEMGAGGGDAIVVPSDGHPYVLLVDSVEDVVEAQAPRTPLKAPLSGGWARVACAMVQADGQLLLLVDPHAIIAGPAAALAA